MYEKNYKFVNWSRDFSLKMYEYNVLFLIVKIKIFSNFFIKYTYLAVLKLPKSIYTKKLKYDLKIVKYALK